MRDHRAGGAFGAFDQRLNQRSLRQVPPISLRHFGLHGLHLQPRRIEDAGVIAPPGFLQPILGRRLGLADPRRDRDGMAVPMRADIRRQDRPGHVGKAAGEERRCQFDDMMLRLEPGDEMRFLLAADFAEADEGVHLVLVVMHGLRHRGDSCHIRIGRDDKQVVVAAQPPQQAIEHGKAFAVAMQDRGFCQFDEFGRDVEGAVWRVRAVGWSVRTVQARRLAHAMSHRPGSHHSAPASAPLCASRQNRFRLSRVMWCIDSASLLVIAGPGAEAIHFFLCSEQRRGLLRRQRSAQ